MIEIIINFFFPKFCINCRKNGAYICKECFNSLSKINLMHKCHVCSHEVRVGMAHRECREKSYLDGLIYVSTYNNFIKSIIQEGKYGGTYEIFKEIGKIVGNYINSFYKVDKNSIVTFVPLSKFKKNFRGFNQSEIICKEIAKELNLEVATLLNKPKSSRSQATLSREERNLNLKNKFILNSLIKEKNLNLKKILIVDDIYTTGNTLNECAKTLKASINCEVYGIVFAKSREWKEER